MATRSNQWVLASGKGLECLVHDAVEIPSLGRNDVLVKFRAASLNYRDVAIIQGTYPRPQKPGIVPGSDGAGKVIATGAGVTEFKPGDRVTTCFFQDWVSGRPTLKRVSTALGSNLDGVFREYGVFPVHGLVSIPPSLSWREASTLSCAALTAWSCLHGERPVAPGDVVLIQGTGGVSLFGLQFAVAAGAQVIATTSSDEKAEFLKGLGAKEVINYTKDANWGQLVRRATPNQMGCDIILDVGGSSNWAQSVKAVKPGGDIHLIGFLGGQSNSALSIWETRQALCNLKSIAVGSRAQFEEMNAAIEAFKIKPIVDESVFDLTQLKEAYDYLLSAKHQGKVIVNIGNS